MDVHTELHNAKRNILALNEGLKMLNANRQADYERIQRLEQQIAMMAVQMQNAMQQVAILRAVGMGHGATG